MSIRVSSIDVGSNSIKLLVLDIEGDSQYQVVYDSVEFTGLGTGLGEGDKLNPDARDYSIAVIETMIRKARSLGAETVVAAGTSALRRAQDAREFIAEVHDKTGVEIKVLTEEEEATISRAVVLREFHNSAEVLMLFDVGGGSTEISLFSSDVIRYQGSLPLGARRVMEWKSISQPPTPNDVNSAVGGIDTVIREHLGSIPDDLFKQRKAPDRDSSKGLKVAGLGGTATALVWMLNRAACRSGSLIDPHLQKVKLQQVDEALESLLSMSLSEVEQIPGMDKDRAPVFLCGLLIISRVLHYCGARGFTLVDRGLRFGLLLG